MVDYTRAEARDWARERFRGVNNVIIPSFTPGSLALNEAGIRHDIRRDIELGFNGALLVSEVNISLDEYEQFVRWSADEAAGRLQLIFHAAFNDLAENIEAVQRAERAGAELALLSYPAAYHPASLREIYEYTRDFCSATNLAVILFPVPHWGFERLHPAGIPVGMLEEMVATIENVAVIKAEGGAPSMAGFAHTWSRLADRVLVTMPIIDEAIAMSAFVPMQVIATSNTEYYLDTAPRMFALAQEGKTDAALDLLWKIAPAWKANTSTAPVPHAHAVNRTAWKYQAWLAGFNGGPLRMPANRLHSKEMRAFRQALVDSGLDVTADDDRLFHLGRHPG